MTQKKFTKTKVKKVSKKSVSPRSKRTSRSTSRVSEKESAVLLSTQMHGVSITHGHTPYQQQSFEQTKKKIDERSKSLIMYIGISFIMVVIVIFWIISLKSTLGPDAFSLSASVSTATDANKQADFDELKNNLSKTLSEVKGEIKSLEEAAKAKPATTSAVSPLPTSSTVSPILPNTLPN